MQVFIQKLGVEPYSPKPVISVVVLIFKLLLRALYFSEAYSLSRTSDKSLRYVELVDSEPARTSIRDEALSHEMSQDPFSSRRTAHW